MGSAGAMKRDGSNSRNMVICSEIDCDGGRLLCGRATVFVYRQAGIHTYIQDEKKSIHTM